MENNIIPNHRQTIEDCIFNETDNNNQITCDRYRTILQDGDVVQSGYEEPFYSENESWDGHFYARVIRKRLESDEEYNTRIEEIETYKREAKKRRHETYLKLKQEFENGN